MKVLIGIPAFNEQSKISEIVKYAKSYAEEVLVCDDGSADETARKALEAGATVISHPTNQGYGAAIATIFDYAKAGDFDILVTLDGDGQHDPKEILQVIRPVRMLEADMSIGSRFLLENGNEPFYRKQGIKLITRLSIKGITDAQSGFRAYNKKVIEKMDLAERTMSSSIEILVKARAAGFKITEVPITVRYDDISHTHNPIYHAADVLAGIFKQNSINHPLLFYEVPALVLMAISLSFFAWDLYLWPIKGYLVTNIAIIAATTGISSTVLGAVGLILWVMITVVRDRYR